MAIINVPAPVGSERAGQGYMQLAQGLGSLLGWMHQKKLTEQDLSSLATYQQSTQRYNAYQEQMAQAEAGTDYLSQLPSGEGLGVEWPAYVPQPELPQFQSRKFQDMMGQMQMEQMFKPKQLLPSQQIAALKLNKIMDVNRKESVGAATSQEIAQRDKLMGDYIEEAPKGYLEDLRNAASAVERGADPVKVYQRIATKYPQRGAELKRVILAGEKSELDKLIALIAQGK